MNSYNREKSFAFALNIIALYRQMRRQNEFVLSKQLLRSGTSIGANISEARHAQSTADFLSKMNISLKEAQETEYWLQLLQQSQLVEYDFDKNLADCNELIKMLSSTVKTLKLQVQKK